MQATAPISISLFILNSSFIILLSSCPSLEIVRVNNIHHVSHHTMAPEGWVGRRRRSCGCGIFSPAV